MSKMIHLLKIQGINIGLWLFWFPFRKIIQHLPINFSLWIGWVIGSFFSRVLLKLRRQIEDEVLDLFDGAKSKHEVATIARKSIQLDIQRRIEELLLPCLTEKSCRALVAIQGENYLKQAMGEQKGTIILLSHFGAFMTILPALGFRGYPINQLGGAPTLKHHRKIHGKIFETKKKDYARLPVHFLRADLHIKELIKRLKHNELIAIAFDGRVGKNWTQVRFFNKPAFFAPGPIRIARKTGAVLLPTFIIRERYNHHRLIFEKPIQLKPLENDNNAFLQENMQIITNIFAEKIARYPSHFAMIMHINKIRAARGIIPQDIFSGSSV